MRQISKTAAFAVTAILMMIMGMVAVPIQAAADVVELDQEITTEAGATAILGGGESFFVKFGTDAVFGVVWGNESVENDVYFVAMKARYLGLAQVYNNDGEMIEGDKIIKIYTMYAVKLDSVLEFNDTDDDGLLNYTRSYDEETDTFMEYTAEETIYKKVDLHTAWNASDVMETETEDGMTWDFSLTAKNLTYELLNDAADIDIGDNVLNELKLSFHLTADLAQYDNVSLPQWRVTVTEGPLGKMVFMNADRLEPLQAEGKIMKYDLKWDQEITGWDFDSNNSNPAVLIEFHSLVGNFVSPIMATWMEMKTLTFMNEAGVMNCQSVEGDLEVNETTGDMVEPKELTQTKLTFGTEFTDIGELTWVDSVTVDGEPELVRVQVMAGHRVAAKLSAAGDLETFTGFVVLGAMVFPGGNSISHDPVFSSEALVDVSVDDGPAIPVFLLLIAAVVIVLIVVAVAAVSSSGKKTGKGDRGSYERNKSSQPGDWSKYYEKK